MFRSTQARSLCAAAFTFLLTAPAFAIPLTYDEDVDGDIVHFFTTFALDFGANTVSGTVTNVPGFTDFDKFNATLPTGGILESVGLTLTQGAGGNGSFAITFEILDISFANQIVFQSVSSGGNFFFPVGQALASIGFVGLNSFPLGMVNDYTITLNVSGGPVAVTEPGVLVLLGAGLLGAGLARRRRKAVA